MSAISKSCPYNVLSRNYIVAHTDDQEAFCKFVDRFAADKENRVWHPVAKTPEDVAKVSELIREQIEKLEREQG